MNIKYAMLIGMTTSYIHTGHTEDNTLYLDDVQVTEKKPAMVYALPNSTTATKTDTPLMETPMTVEVLPLKIIRDLGITSGGLTEALAYVGVQSNGFGAQGESLSFRGFSTSTTLWNGFRIDEITTNLLGANGGVWMDNVERLEVLKGPSSSLYGRAEPGGAVNIVTKKPINSGFYASVNTGIGSWADRWVGADVSGMLNEAQTVRYRLNVSNQDSHSWYTHGPDYHSLAVAPVLEWQIGPNTRLTFEGQYRDLEGISGQPYVPINPATGKLLSVSPKNTLLPGNEARFEQRRSMLGLQHQFNPDWSISWRYMQNQVYSPYNRNNFVLGSTFPITAGNLDSSLMVGNTKNRLKVDASMVDISGHVHTAGLNHTLLLGADYYRTQVNQRSGFDFSQTTNYLDPSPPVDPALTDYWRIHRYETAFYLQDQIQFANDWHLLLGGRYQKLKDHSVSDAPSLFLPFQEVTYEKNVFLPRAGLLWRAMPWLSTYYNYSENMGANTGLNAQGRPLRPEEARQHELGIKTEWLDGRLNALFSVFELNKYNISSVDPANPAFNISVGEVRSRGYELNIQGALTDQWNIILNSSLARPMVIKGAEAASAFTGPTIVAGQLLPYVSNRTFSMLSSYRLHGAMEGWSLGGGYYWSSAPNPQDGATIRTHAYEIVSLFANYETILSGHKTLLQLNINNLFDKKYLVYQGDDVTSGGNTLGGNWGMPRQLKLGVRMEF
jgi:iron complex outermembrane receptor protein